MVVLGAHGPCGARHLVEKETVEAFLNTVAVIKETGDFPKTEQQKQQSAMDELIQEGASKAEIMRTAALKGVSNTYSLERYADAAQAEQEAEEDILDAIDKLMDAGDGTQPKVFLDYLEVGNANGFNSRPLFFQVPRLKRTPLDSELADQALSSRENYQQAMARSKAWNESGILARMGHTPFTPDQIAENHKRFGMTGR